MRQRARTASSLTVLFVLVASTAAAEQFRVRTRVDLVVVPVSVKTSEGRLVAGLSKDDFEIFEDGRPQAVTQFAVDPVPLSAVVLVDTGLNGKSLVEVQESVTALAGAFSAFDEVAVYRFDRYIAQLLDFTNDTVAIEKALKTLTTISPGDPTTPRGPSPLPMGPIINGVQVTPSAPPVTRPTKVLHDAIFTAVLNLEKRMQDRRKIVLVISDGQAYGNNHSFDETVRRLLGADVQVYAVRHNAPFWDRASVLNAYAESTGGDLYFASSTKSLEDHYARIATQARNQYVLAYVSNNEVPGPLPVFRKIEVKLPKAGLAVLHRKGYYQYP